MKMLLGGLALTLITGVVFCQTISNAEREIKRFTQSAAYEGQDEKIIGRMGDSAAVAVTKVFEDKDLTPQDINKILLVIRMSFAAPRTVETESDRRPSTTLFVLKYLDGLTPSPQIKARIAQTREFVEQASRLAATANPK